MFGTNKYVYTCPDVIHNMDVMRRNNRIAIATIGVSTLALFLYGTYLERKDKKNNVHHLKIAIPDED